MNVIPFALWNQQYTLGNRPSFKPDAFDFDWWLTTKHSGFGEMVRTLSRELASIRSARRQHANRDLNLRAVLSTLLDGHDREPGKPTKYARRPVSYSNKLDDRPDWASAKILVSTIDGLECLGLVGSVVGQRDEPATTGQLSLVWPLSPLLEMFGQYGVVRGAFGYDSSRLPVVLKPPKVNRRSGAPLRHSACHGAFNAIAHAAEGVQRFNEFMARHKITLDSLPDGLNDNQGVNLKRTHCYRVFNNVDAESPRLDEGGRWYGGGWQSLKSSLRPYLLIDGQRTVELDYGSFHIRMLYNRDGLESPEEPYQVPGLSRSTAKVITNRLINASNRQIAAACREPRETILPRWGISLPDGVELVDAIEAVRGSHHPIARHFGKGEGLRLQRLDSDICDRILRHAAHEDRPTLPVHDSFIVAVDNKETLNSEMTIAYRAVIGPFNPVIKSKSRPDLEPLGQVVQRNDHRRWMISQNDCLRQVSFLDNNFKIDQTKRYDENNRPCWEQMVNCFHINDNSAPIYH
jgi:hypothetical protein